MCAARQKLMKQLEQIHMTRILSTPLAFQRSSLTRMNTSRRLVLYLSVCLLHFKACNNVNGIMMVIQYVTAYGEISYQRNFFIAPHMLSSNSKDNCVTCTISYRYWIVYYNTISNLPPMFNCAINQQQIIVCDFNIYHHTFGTVTWLFHCVSHCLKQGLKVIEVEKQYSLQDCARVIL